MDFLAFVNELQYGKLSTEAELEDEQLHYRRALLAIATRQFEPLVQFYHQLLQQAPTRLLPGMYAEFQLPGLTLGLFQPKLPPNAAPPPPQPMGLCLEVADLETAIAHLTALGHPPAAAIRTAAHGREIDAYDPDGNWLILYEPTNSLTSQNESDTIQ